MMFVDVLFPNDEYDDDDIQMSSNIDIDVANVYSWSIITTYLEHYQDRGSWKHPAKVGTFVCQK